LEKTLSGDSLIYLVDMRKSDRKDFIEGLIQLFIRELKLERSKMELVVFTKKGFEKETGAAGVVYPYSETLITMDLDSQLPVEKLVDVLSHEMVHVKQIAKGQLKDYIKVNKSKWKNEIHDLNETDYWFQPWEIEAHGMEKGLYVHYLEYMKGKRNGVQKYNKNSIHRN